MSHRIRAWLWSVIVVAVVLFSTADATAQKAGPNDAEVETLIQGVFESDYLQGPPYKDALEKLEIARQSCEGKGCSAKVRAKVHVALGTVFAALKKVPEAKAEFVAALQEDPTAKLFSEYITPEAQKAWSDAQAGGGSSGGTADTKAPDALKPKKSCPTGGRAPRGWKSAEAYCYFNEALTNERAREWTDCAAYAQASLAAENRIQVRFLAASCAERAGLWIEALGDYQIVADTGGKTGLFDAATQARERAEQLRGKIPKVVLRKPANATELVVKMNDVEVPPEKLGGEIWVNPGQRTITARGKIDGNVLEFEQIVDAGEFETTTIDIKLGTKGRDPAVAACLSKAKTREELAECLGKGGPGGGSTSANLDVRVGSELSVYHDNDSTDVVTPAITASVESPTGGWGAGAAFLVDVVTTASIDILANGSPRWTELRYVPAINGHKKIRDVDVALHANLSHEPDYLATAIGASASTELRQKTVTPSLGYEFSYDISGRSGTPFDVFSHTITRHAVDLATTFVLDKATFLTGSITGVIESGDSSKPYRYVPMFSPEIAPRIQAGQRVDVVNFYREGVRVLEQLPTDRQRWALAARIAHRFTSSTIRAEERVYVDSWGLKASTTDGRYLVDLNPSLRVWPHLRFHAQSGVDFWQLAYTATVDSKGGSIPALRTGDRELGPLWAATLGGGGRLALGKEKNYGLTLQGDFIYTSFLDHLFILQRFGYFAALSFDVEVN